MRIIGLVGGTSWVSTQDYYRLLNEGVNAQLGGLNFAECLVYSFNYADIKRNNDTNNWASTTQMLSAAAQKLKQGGAEAIVLCANTMHLIADAVQENVQLPLIHIAEATAQAIVQQQLHTVALLGTRFTMEEDFFTGRLAQHGIRTIIPGDADREFVQYTIYEELGRNVLLPSTKEKYIRLINELAEQGAQGVILGCTEIPMLIKPGDVSIPVFNTLELHVQAAVQFMLQ
ncbi:aspartate/glutamate racemase family protein [Deminuibacter soli]|uniref:Aspartate/glutamate racemase family protein n=1 Tax=Deminuibacter soli TaxID=2291815 RepID=A0A3E1NCI1_9BACT|nr:aspartate/glutamate racemase family protein [Deminuibacter soli]RFM25715.1 aspartate/glutamate racemase family protein [Deminuibacter soli]